MCQKIKKRRENNELYFTKKQEQYPYRCLNEKEKLISLSLILIEFLSPYFIFVIKSVKRWKIDYR